MKYKNWMMISGNLNPNHELTFDIHSDLSQLVRQHYFQFCIALFAQTDRVHLKLHYQFENFQSRLLGDISQRHQCIGTLPDGI